MRNRRRIAALAVLLVAALAVAGCASDGDAASTTTAREPVPSTLAGYVSETYLDDGSWLCRPGGASDVCDSDLTATEIRRDLTTIDVPFEPADDPAVDCFYLYPSVAVTGTGANASPDSARDAEAAAVRDEAARFSSVCRVFAPWYPQSIVAPGVAAAHESEQVAYEAARDAFLHYLAQDNGGRPFALIGHGQGADLLARLVQEEVEPQPDRLAQLLSAMLVGSTRVYVPEGGVVGGSFASVPLCTDRAQNGCLLAYQAFQLGVPPPSGGGPLFAAFPEGMVAPCTSPAGLDGSKGQFRGSYFPGTDPGLPPVPTPYALYREYYRGECATRSGASYLAVDTTTDPSDVRPLGPVETAPGQEAGLGLFDVELELALGDLTDLVETQAAARG